jgi:nitroimidazol reductase NimA-like FMN-containing flavoprotein (pyridoxamine 5'-phosphate oxidase superfamily)
MTTAMTPAEREAFLAGVHVGILAADDPGHGPLAVPVWYAYEPGGTVDIITDTGSRKASLMRAARRVSLCAQSENPPYAYVSVEGPITVVGEALGPDEMRAMAHRYLGAEMGDLYLAATAEDAVRNVAFRMAPERWFSADFAKQFG